MVAAKRRPPAGRHPHKPARLYVRPDLVLGQIGQSQPPRAALRAIDPVLTTSGPSTRTLRTREALSNS